MVVQGQTTAEAVEIAQDVARKLIEPYIEHGNPLAMQKELAKLDLSEFSMPNLFETVDVCH